MKEIKEQLGELQNNLEGEVKALGKVQDTTQEIKNGMGYKNKMKKELLAYMWHYLSFALVITAVVMFAFGQDWAAMIWAILAGLWVNIALRTQKQKDELEQEYKEYIIKSVLKGK